MKAAVNMIRQRLATQRLESKEEDESEPNPQAVPKTPTNPLPLKSNVLMSRLKTQMPQQRRRNIAKLVAGDSDLVLQADASAPNTKAVTPKQNSFAPGSRNQSMDITANIETALKMQHMKLFPLESARLNTTEMSPRKLDKSALIKVADTIGSKDFEKARKTASFLLKKHMKDTSVDMAAPTDRSMLKIHTTRSNTVKEN